MVRCVSYSQNLGRFHCYVNITQNDGPRKHVSPKSNMGMIFGHFRYQFLNFRGIPRASPRRPPPSISPPSFHYQALGLEFPAVLQRHMQMVQKRPLKALFLARRCLEVGISRGKSEKNGDMVEILNLYVACST